MREAGLGRWVDVDVGVALVVGVAVAEAVVEAAVFGVATVDEVGEGARVTALTLCAENV